MRRLFSPGVALALISTAMVATAPARATDNRFDAQTAKLLYAMSSELAAAHRFRFAARTEVNGTNAAGQAVRHGNDVSVSMERPSHLFAHVRGDLVKSDLWFDGHALTKFDVEDRTHAKIAVRGGVEELLDHLASQYHLTFPLADFLVHDTYGNFSRAITSGRYGGLESIDGTTCHRLDFTQADIDWQLWVDGGSHPLPKKIAITYKNAPRQPRWSAVFRAWELPSRIEATEFRARIPRRSARVPFAMQSATASVLE